MSILRECRCQLATPFERFMVYGMATVIAKRRFSVEEYYRMAEVGILKPDDRVELIDGDVVPMAPMSSRHAAAISKIARWLQLSSGGRVIVRVQLPLRLNDYSEPEPDLALGKADAGDYADAHPGPTDVLLLIEVAGTSLAFDRDVKLPHYASAGIAETWLVNLERQEVEIHRQPSALGYRSSVVAKPGQYISPRAFPEATVAVERILA